MIVSVSPPKCPQPDAPTVSRNHALGTVTILTDAQAAIWRMTSNDPGPGQKYAIMARKHIVRQRAGPDLPSNSRHSVNDRQQ